MQGKRITIIVCVSIILVMILVGCKNASTNEVTDASNEQTDDIEITPSVEPDKNKQNEEEQDIATPEVDEFEQENISDLEKIVNAKIIKTKDYEKKILKRLKKDSVKTVYSNKYQEAAQAVLEQYKGKTEYTLDAPLFVLNPYGTIENGMYIYYKSEVDCDVSYSVAVDNEAIDDFQGTLPEANEENNSFVHEGILVGLIQGVKNYVTVNEKDMNGQIIASVIYCINLEKLDANVQVIYPMENITDKSEGTDTELFTLMPDKDSASPNILLVDSKGILRCSIITDGNVNSDVVMLDGIMVFPKDENQFAFMNGLGKVEHILSLNPYRYDSGLCLNADGTQIFFIGSDRDRKSRKDIILKYDMNTQEINVAVDFTSILTNFYEEETLDPIDWLELDSLAFVTDNQILVNSQKLSSIFCITMENEHGELEYIVSEPANWSETIYSDLVLMPIGTFSSFVEQSQISVMKDDKRLLDGQYYIIMFNRNSEDENSCYYKIFVDENTKTYTLAEKIDMVEHVENATISVNDNQYVTFEESGEKSFIGEYNSDTECVQKYYFDSDEFQYHNIQKLDYHGLFLNKEK